MCSGIFLASYSQDRWGYRRTLQIGLIALTGFIFIVFFSNSIEMLFVGQLLCGLPWGAFSSSAVSYASDVTPVSLRGYLTTYINLCWVMGQFLAAGVMVGVQDRTDQWAYRIPFAIQWVWPIPLFIIVTLAPESPWYLVRQNKLAEAEHAVSRLARKDIKVNPANTVAMMVSPICRRQPLVAMSDVRSRSARTNSKSTITLDHPSSTVLRVSTYVEPRLSV